MFKPEEELAKLPDSPGVYLFKDSTGKVIYVGKAVSLRNRVRSYYRDLSGQHQKVRAMMKRVESFETILVGTEVEALVLESNLIKERRPRYNILLRDDKSYPYIVIKNEKFPRLQKTRRVVNDGSSYFGPYPNALAVNEIVDLLHELYPLRTCNLNFDKGQTLERPCLKYFIDLCPAPCVGKAHEETYMENVAKIDRFLKSGDRELEDYLEEQMKIHSKNLDFELAAKYRDYLAQIDSLMEKQRISKAHGGDVDLIAIERGDRNVSAQVFFMRSGKVVDSENFLMEDDFKTPTEEVVSSFMKQFYLNASYIPGEILVDHMPIDSEAIATYLSDKRGSRVNLRVPQRGEKVDLLEMVRKNAQENLKKYEDKQRRRERIQPLGYEIFIEKLGLESAERIECYDISNISGVQSVGSMVVFTNGVKDSREYRKFRIKDVEGPDDYGSMREVLSRRLSRGLRERKKNSQTGFGRMPDLIIVDGGKGQVSAALEVLEELSLSIPVCGLVKDDKHRTRGVIYRGEEILLKVSTPDYRFLYQVQEEAHRFAIDYHRRLRQRDAVASSLEEIPGVGRARRIELMKHFKSVDRVKEASFEELIKVDKINRAVAQNILDYYQEGK